MKFCARLLLSGALAGLALTATAAQPREPVTITITAADITSLRQWDDRVVAYERAGTLRVRERTNDPMLTGRTHERLDQYHEGVRVFGAGLRRQLRDGQVETLFGRLQENLSLSTVPTITSEQARRAACAAPLGQPELVVLSLEPGAPALTWRVRCYFPGDFTQLFVNAHTGHVERRITNTQRQSAVGDGRGVFFDRKKVSASRSGGLFVADDALRPPVLRTLDLKGNLGRAIRILENEIPIEAGDLASDGDNVWEDGAVVDAHVYIGLTYDYFFKRFGRRGLDDRNTPVLSIVHPVTQEGSLDLSPGDFAAFAINAFWCGECGPGARGMMVFGDGIPPEFVLIGSGQNVTFLAASLDIAAHELAHGVTEFTSQLIYEGESGALNEAFSDIIGTSVEFFYQTIGAATGQADYAIGEDSFRAGLAGSVDGIRSMAVPSALGDPDHYSERFLGPEDNGGVHINSSIVNHVYYLAIEGGTHRLSQISVTGVGPQNREQIEKIFYRAFTSFLPPNATFSLARAATLQAARELYGSGSAAERAIATAWTAVGVQ